MNWLSLFSGIAGFELAMTTGVTPTGKKFMRKPKKYTKHNIVAGCEIDKHARSIYTRQFPGVKLYNDVKSINPEKLSGVDGIVAGFPCPTFSIAGRRLGFEEPRGELFFEIIRIAKKIRPRLLLLENVKGLLSHDSGKTFAVILAVLDEHGYDAQWQVLNSKDFGVPQNRERIFIVANLRGTSRPKVFPITRTGQTINNRDATKPIARSLQLPGHSAGNYRGMNMIQVGNIDTKGHNSIWGRVYDPKGISQTLGAEGGGLGAKTGLYAIPILTPQRLRKLQNGRIMKTPGEPSFTLTAKDSNGVILDDHKEIKVRRLTPKECERLQGFPDDWTAGLSDTQRYKCLGNAVTVPVVEAIVNRL